MSPLSGVPAQAKQLKNTSEKIFAASGNPAALGYRL